MFARKSEQARIGRFQILRTLGQGGQGEVYLAEDTQLKRQVAIKTLTLSGIAAARTRIPRKALLDEALIVGQLAHPNIVTLYDAGLEGEMPWLVFEYVEGKTLSAAIKEAKTIAACARGGHRNPGVEGVGFAHGKGVVHRDLKPANVMITGETARVMDFGIAQLVQAKPSPDAPVRRHPSLHGARIRRRPALHSALGSVRGGMLLYAMLTGRPASTAKIRFRSCTKWRTRRSRRPPSRIRRSTSGSTI